MCYASPAPRCSPHALEKKQKAQIALDQASVNLEKARAVGKNTQTALREAKLRNAENEFEVAKAAFVEAKGAYDKAKEEKAAAYKKFKEEEREYHLTPDGIKELRAEGKGELADRFAAERKKRIAEAEAKKAKDEAAKEEAAKQQEEQAQPTLDAATTKIIATMYSIPEQEMCDLASNETTHPAILQAMAEIAGKLNFDVVHYLCENPSTPSKAQVLMARYEWVDSFDKKKLASNLNLSSDAAEVLRKDKNRDIRRNLAENPSLSLAMLKTIASDENDSVRGGVAANRSTPTAMLEAFAVGRGGEAEVVEAVRNPRTPSTAVAIAMEQRPYRHWRTGRGYESLTPPSWWYHRRAVMMGVGRRRDTSPEVLATLLKDKDMAVRERAVLNPNLPEKIFDRQEKNGAADVRDAIKKWRESGLTKEEYINII